MAKIWSLVSKSFVILSATFFLNQCTTTPDVVEKVDDKLDVKSETGSQKIGVNDDGQAIIQEETGAAEELKMQQLINDELRADLAQEQHEVKRCRQDLSDPRLGGDGEYKDITESDELKEATALNEKFGLDSEEKDLKFVKRELYVERLKNERKYEASMRKVIKLLKTQKEKCHNDMRVARTKAGLPAERYKADGYFDQSGNWVETRKAEQTIDDAFEIKALVSKAKE